MRFVLSLILICPATGFLPVTSDASQAEAYNSEVKVQLNIPSQDNFTTDISSIVDILALKGHLRDIFGQHDARIMLRIIGKPEMELINSAAWLDPNFFHQQVGKGGQISNQINVNQSSSYHPLCMYETVEDSISGVFDLCTGVNGYFIYNLNSRISIKTVLGPKGNVKQMVAKRRIRNLNDSLNGFVDLDGNMPNSPLRQKRSSTIYYLAVYMIADFEYYESVCNKNSTECVEVMYRVMKPVCMAFKRKFNLQIYVIGLEVWSGGSPIDVIPNSRESFNYSVFWNQSHEILKYVYEKKLDEDLILYFANSGIVKWLKFNNERVHRNFQGLCNSFYSKAVVSYIDTRYEKTMSLGIVRTITELLGGKPITNNRYGTETNKHCICDDRSYARCFMSVYDLLIFELSMSVYDWGKCNVNLLNSYLHDNDPKCLLDHPGYDDGWARCGNGNVDFDEECEFSHSEGCCTLDCKKRDGVQCAIGDCCNTGTCQRYSSETVCREAAHDCDKPDVCDGHNNYCPADEILCIDGGWAGWTQWGRCFCPGNSRKRTRKCDNPPPSGGGKSCSGIAKERKVLRSCGCTTTTIITTNTPPGVNVVNESSNLLNVNVTTPEPNIVLTPFAKSEISSTSSGIMTYVIAGVSLLALVVILGVAYYHFTTRSIKKRDKPSDVNESHDVEQKNGKQERHQKSDPHSSDRKQSHGMKKKRKKKSHGKRESKIKA